MTDEVRQLIAQAQAGLDRIDRARDNRDIPDLRKLWAEIAPIHRTIALKRLATGDVGGWIDVFAELTALTHAGQCETAVNQLAAYRRLTAIYTQPEAILEELARLEAWMKQKT